MALPASSHMGIFLRNFNNQSIKMTDCFMTDYISDNDIKQFHVGDNITCDYTRFLRSIIKTKEMTDEEYRKYRCNPWYMSDDLYGTTEYWFMLLHLNEMYSATEFTRRKIKIYSEKLPERLNDIQSVMDDYIRLNETDIVKTKREITEGIDGMWF